ncbi:MAG TPA: hypothetical protein VM409_08485 [Chloroflexia bacterium]|nr:hypothetical protein [Chloroflexia bacterium]
MSDRTYSISLRTIWNAIYLLAIAIMLGFGMALASPAAGAELQSDGDITGIVTVNGAGAAGVAVELRQRSNAGADATLASATSDANGVYHFANQPSAPNDAFYYIRFAGAKGTLAAWYTFPIIYVHGSQFTVPGVEMGDVSLLEPAAGAAIGLPGKLSWKGRRSGETYRVFVYAKGKIDKVVLDSGSLGTGTSFTVPEGGLADGTYEAVVQVRDAVVGYGQSQSRFQFSVSKTVAAPGPSAPEVKPDQPAASPPAGSTEPEAAGNAQPNAQGQTTLPPAQPTTEAATGTSSSSNPEAQEVEPSIDVKLSADKTSVGQGEGITYTIEVKNNGENAAEGVVVTDRLPDGVTVDTARAKTSSGALAISGSSVTAQVGNIGPDEKVTIQIPVVVSQDAGGSLSNQASVQYNGSESAVQSNAYIAEVAAPVTGGVASEPQAPAPSQPQQPVAEQPQAPAANPPAQQPQAPVAEQPKAPSQNPPQKQVETQPQAKPAAPQNNPPAKVVPKQPAASIPQTGGAFPVFLAFLVVVGTLLARYLRGLRYRRV